MSSTYSNPNSLVFVAAAFAAIIADGQSPEKIEVLAEFFSALGDNLALIAAQEQIAKEEELP